MKLVLQIAGGIVLGVIIISMVSCGVSLAMLGAATEVINDLSKDIASNNRPINTIVTNSEKNEVLITEASGRTYTSYEEKRKQDLAKENEHRQAFMERLRTEEMFRKAEQERQRIKSQNDYLSLKKFDEEYKPPEGCVIPSEADFARCVDAKRKEKARFMLENGIPPSRAMGYAQ